MRQTNSRYQQIFIVFSMVVLLIAATFFDSWQNWLQENAGLTSGSSFSSLRLWSEPFAILLFTSGWLVLFQLMNKYKNEVTAILFLIVGNCVVFYPTIATTWGLSSTLGITGHYFGNTVLFYSSALVAAMGVIGILTPTEKKLEK